MSINRPLMSRSCPDTAGTVFLLESAYSVLVRLYGWYQAEDIFEQRMKKCKCKQAWIKFRSGPVLGLLLRVCFFRHVFFFICGRMDRSTQVILACCRVDVQKAQS